MNKNLAYGTSCAGALAPFFAVIPGLALPQPLSEPISIANYVRYGALIIVSAYLFMWLVVIPILCLTRRTICWTPFRIVLLGTALGAGPWSIGILWTFARDIALRGLHDALRMISHYEWFPVVWLGACGLVVSAVFVVVQLLLFKTPESGTCP